MKEREDRQEREKDTMKDDHDVSELCTENNIKWKVVCGSCGADAPHNKNACQCPNCGAMAHWISIEE